MWWYCPPIPDRGVEDDPGARLTPAPGASPASGGAPGALTGVTEVLEQARARGFLGPGEVSAHVHHSLAFLALMDGEGAGCLDLGSGGGVPGLILAAADPARSWTLLDAGEQRTAFLEEAVLHLGLQHRVSVVRRRAEEAGRGRLRQACDVVVARGFAAPGPTAECASPLITVGGCLLVAEPPGAPDRWPVAELRELGLEPAGAVTRPVAVRKFRKSHQCPDRYPRRTGVPTKRPLF